MLYTPALQFVWARLRRMILSSGDDLISVTLHQLLVFGLIRNILVALFLPSGGVADQGVRIFGVIYPCVLILLKQFLSARFVFALFFYLILLLATIVVLAGGGIYSNGFIVIIFLIVGSSIAFQDRFSATWIGLWFFGSAAVTSLQSFGYWFAKYAYRASDLAAFVALTGTTLVFGLRVINLIEVLKHRTWQLRQTTGSLTTALQSKIALQRRQERLFGNLSHELRSPATRIGLLFNIMGPVYGVPATESFEKCRQALHQLNETTALSLLFVRLRHGSSYPADQPVDLGNLLAELRSELEFESSWDSGAPSNQVDIQIDADVLLDTSEDILHRVLKGLVQSLWTIGPVVSIRLKKASAGGAMLLFQVDAGLEQPRTSDLDTSIAIQLARRLSELHGGHLDLLAGSKETAIALHLRARCEPPDQQSPHTAAPENTEGIASMLMGHYLIFMSVWGLIWTISWSYHAGTGQIRLQMLGLLVSLLAAAAKWTQRRKGVEASFRLLYSGAATLLIPILILGGGIQNQATYLFATLVFSTVIVYSVRTACISLALTLTAYGVMTAIQINRQWPSSGDTLPPFAQWMVLITIGATAALVIIPFILMYRKVLHSLEREKQELAISLSNTTKLETAQREIIETATRHMNEPFQRFRSELRNWQARPDAPPVLPGLLAECDRLEQVIRETAHISSGKEEVSLSEMAAAQQRLDIARLLETLCADLEVEAVHANCSLCFHAQQPLIVEGAPGLIRSAIENVIRNAIRWTAAGSRIQVDLVALENTARISVRDHGPGVPEDSLSRIFEPFVQAYRNHPYPNQGVGLGLAIARDVVVLHGGEISASNVPQGGLEVRISIPRFADPSHPRNYGTRRPSIS